MSKMLVSIFSVAITGLMTLVTAQNNTYPYLIDPNDPTVSSMTRNGWCIAQQNSCRQICGGSAPTDICDPTNLTWQCVCGDGSSPNITQYNSTLPFFECQIYQQQCLARNPTDAQAQLACNAIPCGGKDPVAAQSSASAAAASSMMTTSSSSASSTGGSATEAAAGSSSSAAPHSPAPKISLDPYLTIGVLVGGLMFLGGVAL